MGDSLEVGVRDLPMEDAEVSVGDRMFWSEDFFDYYESSLVA
jgi:hypothetical protein